MREALSLKEIQKDREIEKLRRKIEKLEGFLKEKDKKIRGLRERLNPNRKEFKPVKCPYCGFEKVYKNGTYKRKPKGFLAREKLKIGPERR